MKSTLRRLTIGGVVLAGVTGAWAQEAAPVAPVAPASTQPAGESPEAAAVKDAVLKFADAMVAADTDAIRASWVGSEDDAQTLVAMSKIIKAQLKLRDAAKAKLENGGGQIARGADPREATRAAVARATIKLDGDNADVVSANGQTTQSLKKADGIWKVATYTGLDQVRAQLGMLLPVSQAMDEVAEEILAGKYTTEQQVMTAIQAKMQERMGGGPAGGGATTGPTTRP